MSALRLVLLRHGESTWNAGEPVHGLGRRGTEPEGRGRGGSRRRSCWPPGFLPDVVHTSVLQRAIRTTELALAEAGRPWVPVRRSWRLNERHYGALQGKSKAETRLEFGDEQFMLWRRTYDVPPPPLEPESSSPPAHDPRYARAAAVRLPADGVPEGRRSPALLPYWCDAIVPDLRAGQTVLVAAHGNRLRALIKHLDDIADDEIAELERADRRPARLRARQPASPYESGRPRIRCQRHLSRPGRGIGVDRDRTHPGQDGRAVRARGTPDPVFRRDSFRDDGSPSKRQFTQVKRAATDPGWRRTPHDGSASAKQGAEYT